MGWSVDARLTTIGPVAFPGAAGIITTRSNIKHASPTTAAPGAAAGSINTTRSNIKSGGGSAVAPTGSAGDAPDPVDQGEPDAPGVQAAGINTTRSNIKHASAAGVVPDALRPTPTRPGDPFPTTGPPGSEPAGIAIKEQGVKVDGGAMASDDAEPVPAGAATKEAGPTLAAAPTDESTAMEGEPVPGLERDTNPGGATK